MSAEHGLREYVVLPPEGLLNTASTANPEVTRLLTSLEPSPAPRADGLGPMTRLQAIMPMGVLDQPMAPEPELRVLDSISEDGAKLVEMSPETALQLRAQQPGLRVLPVVYFYPAVALGPVPETHAIAAAGPAVHTTLKIVSAKDGAPVSGARVVAFTNFKNREGVERISNDQGDVSVPFSPGKDRFQRVYVTARQGFWGAIKKNLDLTSGMKIRLRPLDLSFTDGRRHFYADAADNDGHDVRVGVVDSGIAEHPDLVIEGGQNTVDGEDPQQFGDNGLGHGTHVAGIIAARGRPGEGMRGVAPAVALRSYRVFGLNAEGSKSFAIIKAIHAAVADGCDLINLSLGGGLPDDGTRTAIQHARANGSLVIAANGNDGRQPVSFPALDPGAIAVAALGRRGAYPNGTLAADDIKAPFGDDHKNFVAAFSNIGPETDLIAPGVAIVSTVPGGYAPMNGTSMACPAVTGRAAQLLAKRPDVLGMARDQARSDAMATLLFASARRLGFGGQFEGQGIP